VSTPIWTLDPTHSNIEFSVAYMGLSTYRTNFRALEGSLVFDPADPARASVTASIPVSSVDVSNERLLGRLMDDDFFGAKDHPAISFRSTRVEPVETSRWKVAGELTIQGKTHPVTLDTQYLGQAKSPFSGKMTAHFRAETEIDRGRWGLTWNAAVETGAAYLGERVRITLQIIAVRQD
jgi:polyisoprenoid-binding protein YceI